MDTHQFVHNYEGAGAFGLDRETDEETLIFYLQKFSEDKFMAHLLPKLSNEEITRVYDLVNHLIHKHLSEEEYHRIFLKDR
ncbi:conserved hypothetical protein [Desulfamplus magnetovallimortis]|uniref:Cytoplasmic protein n=1 Tax=Desulfamplus magnetovallimortis TaxID=1246637 RepID=L0R3S0_9BACT|nr:cytoplasmic protein [Desulfamplus magnetovallimortis]CCO06633.1 conserved hypothetical protein [Desulfamplus magnetovallimortis BW-1]SLM32684.1 conserved hypothetical protein [Desulfamplus magnetovallimortis]